MTGALQTLHNFGGYNTRCHFVHPSQEARTAAPYEVDYLPS
jgi:hypothetical protein